MSTDLTTPRNASEFHYLVTPTPGMLGLKARQDALAFIHARFGDLPDNTASAASRAAYALHIKPAPPAPPPLPVYPPRVAVVAPARPMLPDPARIALEVDVVSQLESCVGWVRQSGKSTESLARVEKNCLMASNRASQAVARWTAEGRALTARMTELDGIIRKESKALLAARAAAESAQRMAGR